MPRIFFGAAIVTGVFFALWTWLVMGRGLTQAFDTDCANYWTEQAQAHRWGFMVFCTDLGGVAAMTLLTILGALWQASLRNWMLALAWIAVMVGGGILNSGSKHLVGRDRPDLELRDKSVLEVNKSYPSGHAMGSTIGYGMLAYCLCLWQRCRRTQTLIVVATIALVMVIGFSRMYLRAHWFSDVIGGWSLGLTWLLVCFGLARASAKF